MDREGELRDRPCSRDLLAPRRRRDRAAGLRDKAIGRVWALALERAQRMSVDN